MKNHLGSYECKLCLTLHNNEVILYFCLYAFKLISKSLFLLYKLNMIFNL